MKWLLLGFIFLTNQLHADKYEDMAKEMQEKAMQYVNNPRPQDVPGYQKGLPAEVRYNNRSELDNAASNVRITGAADGEQDASKNAVGLISGSLQNRAMFKISSKDSIVENSNAAIKEPQKSLKDGKSSIVKRRNPQIFNCKQPRAQQNYKCREKLISIADAQRKSTYLRTWLHGSRNGADEYSHYRQNPNDVPSTNRWLNRGNWEVDHVVPQYKYEIKDIDIEVDKQKNLSGGDGGWREVTKDVYDQYDTYLFTRRQEDKWLSSCSSMPQLTQDGICRVVNRTCVSKDTKRSIDGQIVERPCWAYNVTYDCFGGGVNECEKHQQSKCDQIASKCLKQKGEMCVLWEQTYECGELEVVKQTSEQENTLDLDPKQADKYMKYDKNTDFGRAVATLSIFSELKKDIANNPNLPIFTGKGFKCRKACAGFRNCCLEGKGWSKEIGMNKCNPDEEQLALNREKKFCVEVGEYTSRTVMGQSVQKKRGFCCFPTKLSRIFHEQGRRQLGISWGDAKNPECRGLTIDELSRMDFSKLDLSELFEDIMAKVKAPDAAAVQGRLSRKVEDLSFENDLDREDF